MGSTWHESLVEHLTESTVFGVVPPITIEALAKHARKRSLSREAILWAWGDEGEGVAVLLEGALDVQRTSPDGKTVCFRRLDPGDIVGFSTIAGEPHTADIVAAESSRVAILPRNVLEDVIRREPELALAIIGHLGHLIGLLTDEKAEWRVGSVIQRVCEWLHEHGSDRAVIHITHRELGAHVGASRENVSRALRALAKAGVIRQGRGSIEILALARCDEAIEDLGGDRSSSGPAP